MQKPIIGIIVNKPVKKTIKEVLDQAFKSSDLDYEVSKEDYSNESNDEKIISEAIKNTPKLEVDLKNCDYFA